MIAFNKSKFEIKNIHLIAVSSALGGSFTELKDGQEIRHQLPFSVARKLTMRFGKRMIHPIPVIAIMYDGKYIAVDGYEIRYEDDQEITDTPFITDIRSAIDELSDDSWSFDGRFVFKLHNVPLDQQPFLSEDGMFRVCEATCIDLQGIRGKDDSDDEQSVDVVSDRQCISVVSSSGKVFTAPPIWTDLTRNSTSEDGKVTFFLDEQEKRQILSIDWTINVAKVIGYHFGYNSIEPLHIPDLLISLGTLNLAGINKNHRQTIDCGISLKNALAYLIGYLSVAPTLEVYQQIRQCIKHTYSRWLHSLSDKKHHADLVNVFAQVEMLDSNIATNIRSSHKEKYNQAVLGTSSGTD